MREKLIELLEERRMQASEVLGSMNKGFGAWYADHLIANGVTFVPSRWIPVTERLPERNTEVLVCDTREDYVSVWGYMGDGLWYGNDVIWATEDITHWMPLPEPPKGE